MCRPAGVYIFLLLFAVTLCFSKAAFVPTTGTKNHIRACPTRCTNLSLQMEKFSWSDTSRRRVLLHPATAVGFLGLSTTPLISNAEEFIREGKGFEYVFTPPNGFEVGKKPLQTHLDEINFKSTTVKGYQVGITVDPVRINSLREFGTPEEVAARVVTAEVNRDGVFDVTLVSEAIERNGAYELNYLSKGKRGVKHYVANIVVQGGKLFVLTAQVLEESYKEVESELFDSVRSFRVTKS